MWNRFKTNKVVACQYPNDSDGTAFREGFEPLIKASGYKAVDGGAYQDGISDFTSMTIIGGIVFFVLQQTLSHYGTWYFIILGLLAMAIAIWAPRGLWGLFADRWHIRLFPVGYWLWPAAAGDGPPRPRELPFGRRRAGAPGPPQDGPG
jgi:hypothetical protein